MELGTSEREIFVEAAPEVVLDVVSKPEQLQEWWPDEAAYEPVAGAAGEIVFGERGAGGTVVSFDVVEALPPRSFSFCWTHPAGEPRNTGWDFYLPRIALYVAKLEARR